MDNEQMPKKPRSVQHTTHTLKNGDVIVREYDQTAANSRWWYRHKEEQLKTETCTCGGTFSKNSANHHKKSKRHKRYAENNKIEPNILS